MLNAIKLCYVMLCYVTNRIFALDSAVILTQNKLSSHGRYVLIITEKQQNQLNYYDETEKMALDSQTARAKETPQYYIIKTRMVLKHYNNQRVCLGLWICTCFRIYNKGKGKAWHYCSELAFVCFYPY